MAKRAGRPVGTSPHGLPPGSNGGPEIRFRVSPEDHKRIQEAGGSSWARDTVIAILDIRRDEGHKTLPEHCEKCGAIGMRLFAFWHGSEPAAYYCKRCMPVTA